MQLSAHLLVARLPPFEFSAVVKVETAELLRHLRSFLLLLVGAVLVYFDILEEAIYDIDNLHQIIRDILLIQFLSQQSILNVSDGLNLLLRCILFRG